MHCCEETTDQVKRPLFSTWDVRIEITHLSTCEACPFHLPVEKLVYISSRGKALSYLPVLSKPQACTRYLDCLLQHSR